MPSTPLDQLQTADSSPADEERVRAIMSMMNTENTVQAPPSAAPMELPRVITEPPISTSTGDLRMDSNVARANIIGNSAPTMADFQAMFQQTSPGMAPIHGSAMIAGSPNLQMPKPTSGKSMGQAIADQFRGPVAVAIIVFFLNMPVITSFLSRYAAWMYNGSGEISIAGLFVKALLAATLFAVYQGVTAFLEK
jgi:hypothetical protein